MPLMWGGKSWTFLIFFAGKKVNEHEWKWKNITSKSRDGISAFCFPSQVWMYLKVWIHLNVHWLKISIFILLQCIVAKWIQFCTIVLWDCIKYCQLYCSRLCLFIIWGCSNYIHLSDFEATVCDVYKLNVRCKLVRILW